MENTWMIDILFFIKFERIFGKTFLNANEQPIQYGLIFIEVNLSLQEAHIINAFNDWI